MDKNTKKEILYAYLAGCMDSDGYFTIKKSTYHMRVTGDAKNPIYSESVGLRQVTPQVPYLLKDVFGGLVTITSGHSENSKPLYNFRATDKVAFALCSELLPYLLIKIDQAQTLIELRDAKQNIYEQHAYWFVKEFPDWQNMEMIDAKEVSHILGYSKNSSVVSRAIMNGTLLAKPLVRTGPKSTPRFPKELILRLKENSQNGKYGKPKELMDWRDSLYQRTRELNKIGINGTSVYHRTGVHAPK